MYVDVGAACRRNVIQFKSNCKLNCISRRPSFFFFPREIFSRLFVALSHRERANSRCKKLRKVCKNVTAPSTLSFFKALRSPDVICYSNICVSDWTKLALRGFKVRFRIHQCRLRFYTCFAAARVSGLYVCASRARAHGTFSLVSRFYQTPHAEQ